MARAHVFALVTISRLRDGVARHWRRLIVGAIVGWALSSILGAFVLALWLPTLSPQVEPVVASVIVWAGIGLGVLTAYAARERREQV